MSKEYTVREFIRLTPPQKLRLQKRDPMQYKRLAEAVEKSYPKESDTEILMEISKTPKRG